MRVVITGMGAITPAGKTPDELFERALSGVTTVSEITAFDTSDYKCHFACEVKDFDPTSYGIDAKAARRMDRYCQFAMAAATDAYDISGLERDKLDITRCGVIFGSGIGGLGTLEEEHTKLMEKGPGRVSPVFIPMMISNIACGNIAMKYGFKGTCYATVTACASSATAIGEAFRHIKDGYADVVIAGGSEATITKLAVAGFSNMTALTHGETPDTCSLPFDKRRSGFTMGEGGAALVLEAYDHAVARGAKIYGEIIGYGTTSDAYHITAPDPEASGATLAMSGAIKEGGITPEMVDYINAHGTGTAHNDSSETLAVKKTLGEAAYKVAISSTKGVTGHLLGAAGATEAIITAMALDRGIIPPTANLREPDPELDLDYTPLEPKKRNIKYALSNSLGFGGTNVSLLFKKFEA
ncbi:MAG: beta-ketoacyl-ACP synthase II [Clostridia bacterium]|nr:beta-ketoacyl-ACP synthase II [Clostridia bacterium]